MTTEEILKRNESDPNFQRFGFTAPVVPKQPVSILSSKQGKEITQKNKDELARIEEGIKKAKEEFERIRKEAEPLLKKKEPKSELKPEPLITDEERTVLGLPPKPEKTPEEIITEQLNTQKLEINARIDNEVAGITSQYDAIQKKFDTALQLQIENIKSIFGQRKKEMQDINERRFKVQQTIGIRKGTARYAPDIEAGILTTEEREGMGRLSDLDVKEQSAIVEAKNAMEKNEWTVFNEKMKITRDLREKQEKEIGELQKTANEELKKIKEKNADITLQETVGKLFDAGIDNASDMQEYFKKQDLSFDLEKIEKYLKIINPPESLAGMNTDYRTYKQLIKEKDPDVKGLTWLEYKEMIENLERAPERITGDVGEFMRFFPATDLTTPEGQQQFLDWEKRQAEAGRKPIEVEKEKPLSILDIGRYQELYPEAGVISGDTQTMADEKVLALSKPRDFSDEDFRITFRDLKTQNISFENARIKLEANPIISNKERGQLILKEIYKIKEKAAKETILPTKKEITILPKIEPVDFKEIGTSFFNKLFGK